MKKQVIIATGAVLLLILAVLPLPAEAGTGEDTFIEDLDMRGADLRDVFRLLSDIAEVNLILHQSVAGTFTTRLKEVTFREALDLITFTHDLAYIKIGKTFIVAEPEKIRTLEEKDETRIFALENAKSEEVRSILGNLYTDAIIEVDERLNSMVISGDVDELAEMAALIKELDAPGVVIEEDETRVFRLDYSQARDIRGILTSIYDDIKVEIYDRDMLIIKAGAGKMLSMEKLIKQLDSPKPLISTEVRVEEISITDLHELGIRPEELTNIRFIKGEEGGITDIAIDFPNVLRMLEEEGVSRNLARPRLTTQDGEVGRLLIGDRIPVRSETVEDDQVRTAIEYIEVGIRISFETRVSDDGYITLTVKPEVSSIGEELFEGFPTIKTREAETTVRIKSGETFAIGGLIQTQEMEAMAKVPFLSELPILGELFKRTRKDDTSTELIIFITSEIIYYPEDRDKIIEEAKKEQEEKEKIEEEEPREEEEEKEVKTVVEYPDDLDIPPHVARWLELFAKGESLIDEVEDVEAVEEELEEDELEKEEEKKVLLKDSLDHEEEILLADKEEEEIILAQTEIPASVIKSQVEYHFTYTVKPGENLWRIGRKFGIPYEWIQEINVIEDIHDIKIGEVLIIPVLQEHLYEVQEGDSLASIAERHGVSLDNLLEINNLEGVFILSVGEKILLPVPAEQ